MKSNHKWLDKIRRCFKRNRDVTLREFVYIDQTSLHNLYMSVVGTVPETETYTNSSSFGLEGGANASIVGTKVNGLKSKSAQRTSRFYNQMLFKDFLISVKSEETKKLSYINLLSGNDKITSDLFMRGKLLEVEVTLAPEPIYKVYKTIGAMMDLVEENSELRENLEKKNDLKTSSKMLDKLMFDLIPIKSEVLNYEVLGEELRRLDEVRTELRAEPLYITGVLEEKWLLADIRRILFSNTRFTVLCRLIDDGFKNSWTPIKSLQLLNHIHPGLEKQIQALFDVAFSGNRTISCISNNFHKLMDEYLDLRFEGDNLLDDREKRRIYGMLDLSNLSFDSAEDRLKSLRTLDAELVKVGKVRDISSDQATAWRSRAYEIFQDRYVDAVPSSENRKNDDSEHILEVEIIAIYW